ncbi:hypothetical protein K7G98_02220 [Saccharothrix sp. MB29]|nr:hypothetical protein [Saccharothrix sp. MB29]
MTLTIAALLATALTARSRPPTRRRQTRLRHGCQAASPVWFTPARASPRSSADLARRRAT